MPFKALHVFILILVVILSLRIYSFYSSKSNYKNDEYLSFTSRLFSEPKIYKTYQNFSIEAPNGEQIFVRAPIYPIYYYGDRISISGNLKIKLLNNYQLLSLDFPKISLEKAKQADFLAVVISIRQKIISFFSMSLPKDSSALLLGVVFGIKGELTRNFYENIKTAGVMHVIAASGMNVTMVGGFMFYIFSLILKRQVAIFASIMGILFYAFLAGFEASIIRASIMGIIAFSSQVLGKQNYGFYALILTAVLMLSLWPKFLIDIGFQLSFMATLGILFIPRIFKSLQNPLSENFLTTVSAQIATMPILLVNFGSYSLWSIVVNTLVLWTIPILMAFGGVAAILSFVFEPLARLFLYLCLPFLFYFEHVVNFFGGLNAGVSFSEIPWQFSASYYLLLASVLIILLRKHND